MDPPLRLSLVALESPLSFFRSAVRYPPKTARPNPRRAARRGAPGPAGIERGGGWAAGGPAEEDDPCSSEIGERSVSAIGFGEMPLSIEGRPDEAQAMRTVHASLDAGVTIIDTADAYCLNTYEHGHGERLVAKALAT